MLSVCVLVLASSVMAEAGVLRVPTYRYRTIQQAIDMATEGDTILVEPGSYNENLEVYEKSVTLVSQNAHLTPTNRWIATIQVGYWFSSPRIVSFTLRGFTVESPRHIALGLEMVDQALISRCHLSSGGSGEYRALNVWDCGIVKVHRSCLSGSEEVLSVHSTEDFSYSTVCD